MSGLILKYVYDDERYTYDIIRAISLLKNHLNYELGSKILNICLDGISKEREKDPDKYFRKGLPNELAEKVGVNRNTILRYISKGINGSNKNMFILTMISLDYNKDETIKILEEGLNEYYTSVDEELTKKFEALEKLKLEIKSDISFNYVQQGGVTL